MSRASRRLRPLLGILLGCSLLLLVEGALRLVSSIEPAYSSASIAGWQTRPNLPGTPFVGNYSHAFTMKTNADGLRSDVRRERTPGKKRVALMGDSTVFGWGVDEGGTVAEGLAAKLPDTEVINAGQPGYSTTQSGWFFKEVLSKYKPDVTVVFQAMHDFNTVLVSDREVLKGAQGTRAEIRVALARHSRIYSLLRGVLFSHTAQPFLLPMEDSGEPRVPRVSDAEREEALEEMRSVMAAWGGKLAIGNLPFQADVQGLEQPREGDEWAEEWAKRTGTPRIDVRKCCVGGKNLVLADDPGHLTKEGNAQAGAAMAEKVSAMLR